MFAGTRPIRTEHTGAVGRAYLDLDGSGNVSTGDYIMSWRVPVMFGKRYYSVALTQALLDNGALTLSTWPADLATPEEAARDWPFRESPGRYADLRSMMPDLKVMLVFAQDDHHRRRRINLTFTRHSRVSVSKPDCGCV